jgi:hypothetical protein
MAPRYTPLDPNQRPSLGDNAQEIDDEMLKKAFEKPVRHQEGAVVCRFCKGPLFLGGDFCEHCGAPVAEAAPPGLVPPKSLEPEPPSVAQDNDPLAAVLKPAQPDARAVAVNSIPAAPKMSEPAPPPIKPAAPSPARPHNPYLTSNSASEEDQPGLMGRLKGIFKKS